MQTETKTTRQLWGVFRGQSERVYVEHVMHCLKQDTCRQVMLKTLKFPQWAKFDERELQLILYAQSLNAQTIATPAAAS